MDAEEIAALLDHMARQLRAGLAGEIDNSVVVGIHTGGFWLARRLHEQLGLPTPLGGLNISFYRDDFGERGLRPQSNPSDIPLQVDGHGIVLVDDVLFTGRTVRAAVNGIFDYGRPRWIKLAVLVDRGGRELPIAADVVGQRMELAADEHIKLTGPSPLRLEINTKNA
jgi:pyrimidine operon attenuation protein/uracil phosphoribosyltransferase